MSDKMDLPADTTFDIMQFSMSKKEFVDKFSHLDDDVRITFTTSLALYPLSFYRLKRLSDTHQSLQFTDEFVKAGEYTVVVGDDLDAESVKTPMRP